MDLGVSQMQRPRNAQWYDAEKDVKFRSVQSWYKGRKKSAGQLADQGLHGTSGYATWFTAGGAIRIAHYDVIDDIITRKL